MKKTLRISRTLWLLALCLTSISSWAQITRTVTVSTTGGSSTSSVQSAFISAVTDLLTQIQAANALSPSAPTYVAPQTITWRLVIPPLAGGSASPYYVGNANVDRESPIAINLQNLQYAGLTINSGMPGVTTYIKYIDGLKFGIDPADNVTYSVGCFIYLQNCRNVVIHDLNVNGNNPAFIRKATNSDHGYQLDNDGIFLGKCRRVRINNVSCKFFGRDGIQVNSPLNTPTPTDTAANCDNVRITNSHFDYNARQGLSWTGGCGLVATTSSFSHTGRGVPGSTALPIINGPTAGIDIEPEGGFYGVNLSFSKCHIKDNFGRGVLSDSKPAFIFHARNVSFDSCTINNYSGGPAIWTVRPNFTYTNCDIVGRIQGCYYGSVDAAWATRFTNCRISDTYIDAAGGKHPSIISEGGDNFLLALYRKCIQTRFTRCEFYAGNLNLANIDLHGVQDTAQWVIFEDNTFNLGYKLVSEQPQQSWTGSGTTSRFCGVIFKGNNEIRDADMGNIGGWANTPDGPINKGWRNSFGSVLITSGSAHTGKLTLDTGFKAGHLLELENETFTIGKTENDVAALVLGTHDDYLPETTITASTPKVKAGAYMLLSNASIPPIIRVGTKSMIHVREGALLRGQDSDKLYLNGRFIVDGGAYLGLAEYFRVMFGPKSEVYVHKNAIIAPDERRLPVSVFGALSTNCVLLTCVHGGNPRFDNQNSFLCTEGMKFNGTTDYVTVQDKVSSPKLNFGTNDFAIDLAFKMPASTINRPMLLFTKANGTITRLSGGVGYKVEVQDGFAIFMEGNAMNIATKYSRYTSDAIFANDACYNVLVTRTESGFGIFINGAPVGVTQVISSGAPLGPENLSSPTAPLYFGYPSPDYSFSGIIDEVHIWNGARTSYTDVQSMSMPVTGLLGAWSMQQPDGFIRYNNCTDSDCTSSQYPCNIYGNYEEVPDLSQVMPADRLSGTRSTSASNRWVTKVNVSNHEEGLLRPNMTPINTAPIFLGIGCISCTPSAFTAPTATCSGSSLTFSTSPDNNISWQTSPAGVFTPSSGTGSSFTTTPSSPTAIIGTVTATRTNCSNPQSFSSNIAIRPTCPESTDFPITQTRGQYNCLTNRCHYDFSITNPLGWPYNWSLDGSYSSTSIAVGRATPSPFVPLPTGNGPGTMTIYCVFRDPAGCCDDVVVPVTIWYDGIYGEIHRSSTSGTTLLPTQAYPNPASDYLTLPAGATQVEFRSVMGKPVLNSSQNKVDVQNLPDGLYSVTYLLDGKSTTQRIQIKH
ncbi:LamG-like jellyroll fold domain-containing protein [Hymenobacter sp. ASUV-10]|uniref:LamG-like jellyroll fold domain-containing protein n=1 Tax=Hymenobacter aranciens TaxID=3063996 RepID=A0ABT9BLE3_9BACT|nr:LamG-like jellyroll fold domain-containing protein [Hymenobacter sp. ASUV-10]MDO7877363.1 LamG-like jellyroll fold domain-containing protein [Hymenobacter sp. ASUV-10]